MSYSCVDYYGDLVREFSRLGLIDEDKLPDEDGQSEAADMCLAALDKLHTDRAALIAALEDLRKEMRAHVKLDVKKHYSLMVADAAAGTAIFKATEGQS